MPPLLPPPSLNVPALISPLTVSQGETFNSWIIAALAFPVNTNKKIGESKKKKIFLGLVFIIFFLIIQIDKSSSQYKQNKNKNQSPPFIFLEGQIFPYLL